MKEKHRAIIRKVFGRGVHYLGITHLFYQRSLTRDNIWILAYHRIDGQAFEAHLRYLMKRDRIVSLPEAYAMLIREKALPAGAVALTFDDSHLSFYEQIYPLLQKYRIPAAVFIATDFIETGKKYWFDSVDIMIDQTKAKLVAIGGKPFKIPGGDRFDIRESVKEQLKAMCDGEKQAVLEALAAQWGDPGQEVPRQAQIITWAQAKEMQGSELVDFGAHTCSHPILTQIPRSVARKEIVESKMILESQLGKSVDFFAYPNGSLLDINEEIIGLVQKAGYRAAFTLIEGACRPGDNLFTLRRLSASGAFEQQTLAMKMSRLWFPSGPAIEFGNYPSAVVSERSFGR